MSRRSFFLAPIFGLLASLALASPSMATPMYVVNVQEGFNVSNATFTPTITSVTYTFSGLDTVSGLSVNARGVTSPFAYVDPTIGSNGTTTVTISYSPAVLLAGGSFSFDTLSTTSNVTLIASEIKLVSAMVTAASGNTLMSDNLHFTVLSVPEPNSMALLGIGMTSFLAFRRFFKRTPLV